MELVWHILMALLGMGLIIWGANAMTDGSVAVARRLGVSEFLIGATLVALGSSAPDLAIGLLSALKGHTQFAIGNVVGSCTFDGLLVVGAVALIHPFTARKRVVQWQLPCLLVAYAVIIICANDGAIDGAGRNIITRAEGLLMLIVYSLMLWQTLKDKDMPDAPLPSGAPSPAPAERWSTKQTVVVWARIVGGLAILVWGGDIFVDGAGGIAREAHISDTVVGLTIVALGTSLPDLATSAVAAWKGHSAMAVGNVVGSCLFDALVVLGASSLACPLPMGGVDTLDLAAMLSGGVLFTLYLALGRRKVSRWEGAVLVAVYAAYLVHVILSK